MRTLLLVLAIVALAAPGHKPKKKKLSTQIYPRAGYCTLSCDTVTERVTYVDEGLPHCGLDGNFVCPEVVGSFCNAAASKKCIKAEGGYCVARCEMDGKTVSYEDSCDEGYECQKNAKCTHPQRDRSFSRVACRAVK